MRTVLRIGSTDYDHTATGRAAAGIFGLRFQRDLDAGCSLSFSVKRCGASAPFVPGVQVRLTTTNDDGSSPVLRFVGDLDGATLATSEDGYAWAYTCTDLQHRANRVTITGVDGTGTANFNLTPDDPLALYATSGQTVGAIVRAILQAPTNAAALAGFGVGNYASLSPPTLPSTTTADLAALTVVPATPVQLRGESLFNAIQSLIAYWHPKYALWIEPDGTIRCGDVFAFPTATLTCPTDTDNGDPIDWPTYSGPDCRASFTAVAIHGLDIQRAILSLVDGTLKKGWSDVDEAAWTYNDFLMPRDASDEGNLSGVTSSSATVASDHATAHWALNFWNQSNRQGWIQFFSGGASGINLHEERQITSCTALAAGGTATVTWDSSTPLASTAYTRYKIVGSNSPLALVGRKFYVREPVGNLIGAATYVGSHLYPRFPKGSWLANLSSIQQIFYPTAIVRWSSDGSYPWFEVPVKCQVDPRDGSITLTEPAVAKTNGNVGGLLSGWPSSFANGLYVDVIIYVPYNRGALTARYPSSGNAGDAYTKYGITWTKDFYLDSFTWNGDAPSLVALAQQHHAVLSSVTLEGSVLHHEMPAGFDAFAANQALNIVTPGQSTPLDGVPLPVRTRVVDWGDDGPLHTVTFQFSTQRRPFQGDDLYLHPQLSGRSFGTEGELWGPGLGGSMDMAEYNGMAVDMGQMAPPASNPLSSAMQDNPLANQGNALNDAMGDNPLSAAMGNNQIADAIADFGQGGADFGDFGNFTADTAGPGRGDRRSDQQKATDEFVANRKQMAAEKAADRQRARDPDAIAAKARAEAKARSEVDRRAKAAQDDQSDEGKDPGRPIDPDRRRTLREMRGDDR